MKKDYFEISRKEYLLNIFVIIIVIFLSAKLFYGSFKAGAFLMPICIPIIRQRKNAIYEKKKLQLEAQFKDMLVSMSDAIYTGYSIENAIRESYKEMLQIYDYNSSICKELRMMISRLNLNVNAEKVIGDFAERCGLENVKMFSQVFAVAKRSGGSMNTVIRSAADTIKLKQNVKESIDVLISAKKIEQKVIMAVPLFLIIYVTAVSPGFMDIMYNSWSGKIIMTFCMFCYIVAFLWSYKITKVDL